MEVDSILAKRSHESFFQEIDKLVGLMKVDYIDAVVFYCEKHNIEIETAASIIKSNPKFRLKLQSSAEDLNFMPKRAKLPI